MGQRRLEIDVTPGIWPINWPMGLTLLRFFLLPVFLWLMMEGGSEGQTHHHPRRWAVLVFAVMAITDKLDGWLARKLKQVSKVGALLDPVADKLLIASSVVLLSFANVAGEKFRVPMFVVIAIYAKDVLVGVGALVLLYLVGRVTIVPRILGRLSMVLQLALVMATLLGPDLESPVFMQILRFLWVIIPVVAAAASVDYIVQGWKQFVSVRQSRSGVVTSG